MVAAGVVGGLGCLALLVELAPDPNAPQAGPAQRTLGAFAHGFRRLGRTAYQRLSGQAHQTLPAATAAAQQRDTLSRLPNNNPNPDLAGNVATLANAPAR